MQRGGRCAGIAALLASLPLAAAAHDSGAEYIRLSVDGPRLRGEIDLVLRDALALLHLPLDLPEDPAWSSFEARRDELARAVVDGFSLEEAGAPCPLTFPDPWLQRPEEPGLVQIRVEARCPGPILEPTLRYSLLFDLDPSHRAYLALDDGTALHSEIVVAGNTQIHFDLRPVSAFSHFAVYLHEGILHVSTGYDHLLFLAALLLPAALVRTGRTWRPQESVRSVLVEVAAVVSAFTVAHSITLSLAALDIAHLPRRWVESAIALSVLAAALNNLGWLHRVRPWRLAFGFGLIHGFGFAAQLGILGLPPTAKGAALFGFNVGVEIGQLAAASVLLPVLLALRRRPFYRVAVLEVPSVVIAWLAAVWFVERAFGITLLGWG